MTIIVPSKYPDIFQDCLTSINQFAPKEKKTLVRDGEDITPPAGWTLIQGIEPFIYSRNVNLGINACTDNVLLMNDDCCFTHENTVEAMEKVLEDYPDVGILSPKILGEVGNVNQSNVKSSIEYSDYRLAFVCVLIRRAVIDKIGLLDEQFIDYGWDDDDYCRRAQDAGFKLACTADVSVKHGHGEKGCTASFSRTGYRDNQGIYNKKWGPPKRIPGKSPTYLDKNLLVQDWRSMYR